VVAAAVLDGPYRPSSAPAAIQYQERGWSVIPVNGTNKLPLVPWKGFVEHRADPAQIKQWADRFGGRSGIAVITGAVSGLVVLDCDGEEGVAEAQELGVPKTPTVRTPRGGLHYYFELPVDRREARGTAKIGASKHLDVRAYAGYVVAPHTVRDDGRRYGWVEHPNETPLAPPPQWFLSLWAQANTPRGNYVVPKMWSPRSRERHNSHDRGGSGAPPPDDLEAFVDLLPLYIQRYVREGHDLSRFPSRSECDSVVVTEMLAVGADETLIERVFAAYPIGDKYLEPNSGVRYLTRTIDAVSPRFRTVTVKYADPMVYGESKDGVTPPGTRVHLALHDGEQLIRCGITAPDENRSGFAARWKYLFEAVDMTPPASYEEIRIACRAMIGKTLRIKLGGRDGSVVGDFYRA
jgi:hypothetical protein